MREVKERWGDGFAERGLLVAPATAYLSATSEAAARTALETASGIDTLEILSMFRGNPTFGSTQTIYAQLQFEAFYLEQNEYRLWPPLTTLEVVVPGSVHTQLALPWGGFPHPVWFKDDPQIANVRAFGGILDRALMEGVAAGERHYEEKIKLLPKEEGARVLSELAASVQAGTPPRENRRQQRTVDVVAGRGNLESVQVVVHGAAAYLQTGLIQAFAAHHLAYAAPRKVGFASPSTAFGHRELLTALESYGFVRLKVFP